MIQIFTLPLAANEVRSVALQGEYFELRNAQYPVDIELLDRSGGVVSMITQGMESDFVKPGKYETVRITNGANAQTVRYWYGSGDAGSRRFSGSVTGTVALDVATLAALESVDLNAATINQINRPQQTTGFWSDVSDLVSNTPLTVFAPGANLNGAILLDAQIGEFFPNGCNSCFLAKTTAPASVIDGEILLIGKLNSISSNAAVSGQLAKEQFIGPGLGLYYISQSTNVANAYSLRSARWKML